MGPEILVVGDVAAHKSLWHAIQHAGYEVLLCLEHEITGRLDQPPAPAAMVLSMDGTDYAQVLAQVRRHPEGGAMPVVLLAHSQGPVGSLADLIELGADQVLYAPVDPKLLQQALASLAGPPVPPEHRGQAPASTPPRRTRSQGRRRAAAKDRSAPPSASPGQALSEQFPEDPFAPAAKGQGRDQFPEDPFAPAAKGQGEAILGQVHRTLDRVEARLDAHEPGTHEQDVAPDPGEDEEQIERSLAAFRVEDLPHVDAEGRELVSHNLDEELSLFEQTPRERTSTHPGPPIQKPPRARGVPQAFDRTEQIYPEKAPDLPELSDLAPPGLSSARDELARMTERLEQRDPAASMPVDYAARGDADAAGFGHETIRIDRPTHEPVHAAPSLDLQLLDGQRQGLLSQIEVPRLLWEITQARFSGILELSLADDTQLRLAWRKGCVRTLRGTHQADSLPASLWRRLLLTGDQYHELCQIPAHAQVPETLIAQLVRRGWLGVDEEAFALVRWIEDTVLRWWTVGSGTFELHEDPDHWLCSEGRCNWDVAEVFLSACMQQVSPSLARSWLGERSYTPRRKEERREGGLSPEAFLGQRLGASASVRQWLSLADGREVSQIEQAMGESLGSGTSMGLCYALQVLGLVELPEPSFGNPQQSQALWRERLQARLTMAVSGSYFEFLGVSPKASSAQVRVAVQQLQDALDTLESDPSKVAGAQDLLMALREHLAAAENVLTDPRARNMYVQTRGEDTP